MEIYALGPLDNILSATLPSARPRLEPSKVCRSFNEHRVLSGGSRHHHFRRAYHGCHEGCGVRPLS
eukprot:1860891-Pyramimonas_sp.AAC.1